MKPVRELMKDPKVAAGLAVLALVFVVYRGAQLRRKAAAEAAGAAVPVASAPADPAAAVAPPAGLSGGAADNGVHPAPPMSDTAWSWERNPFLSPVRRPSAAPDDAELFRAARGLDPYDTGVPKAPPPAPPAAPAAPAPAAAAPPPEPVPELRGTVTSGKTGIAIFGTRLVPEGEAIGEWTVSRVTAYGVTLTRGGETRTVELPARSVVKGSGGET